MCLICIEFMKGKMTFKEAKRAANEIAATVDDWDETVHAIDIMTVDSEEELKKLIEDEED